MTNQPITMDMREAMRTKPHAAFLAGLVTGRPLMVAKETQLLAGSNRALSASRAPAPSRTGARCGNRPIHRRCRTDRFRYVVWGERNAGSHDPYRFFLRVNIAETMLTDRLNDCGDDDRVRHDALIVSGIRSAHYTM
jgi:hypothetical protein